jgi:hypothetical protein
MKKRHKSHKNITVFPGNDFIFGLSIMMVKDKELILQEVSTVFCSKL